MGVELGQLVLLNFIPSRELACESRLRTALGTETAIFYESRPLAAEHEGARYVMEKASNDEDRRKAGMSPTGFARFGARQQGFEFTQTNCDDGEVCLMTSAAI